MPLVLTRLVGAARVVTHVCPRARQLGVRPGTSLAQAYAQVPQLVAAEHEPARDQAALQRLAHWALRFSPLVEPVEPQTLLIDITGCERLFGGEKRIGQQAVAGLARLGFHADGVIADTVGAAWALAAAGSAPHDRYEDRPLHITASGLWDAQGSSQGSVRVQSKIQNPKSKMDHGQRASCAANVRQALQALQVVPPGQTSAFLASLPPGALRIEPRTADQLDALGVRTIGDLLMLPRTTLPARFGPQLVLRLQQALGEAPEIVTAWQPPDLPAARRTLEHPIADGSLLLRLCDELLSEIFAQLQSRQLALRRLECFLYCERAPPRVLRVYLARPTRTQSHVVQLLEPRLERTDLTGTAVTGLLFVARQTVCWTGVQTELFAPVRPDHDEALAELVDRLAAQLGYDAVLRPRLVDDHQPEFASRYVSVAEAGCTVETEPTQADSDAHTWSGCRPPARPVKLLPRPIPIRVISLVPDGPPTWFYGNGQEQVVGHAAGPERIETAWWRGPDVRRDYFRVTTASGAQYWLFRELKTGAWYLHGVFA
jgi:protein ImuB